MPLWTHEYHFTSPFFPICIPRALLGRRNLTITEGAEKLGVSRSYFSQLLAGRRTLSPKVRRRLLSHAPFSELSADDLWRAPPEEAEEVAHGG